MKKGLLAVLLAVAMVVPAFAAKGDMSVNAKLGLGINNSLSWYAGGTSGAYYKWDTEMPFSIGAEFFYGLMDNLSVGLGVNYVFDTNSKSDEFLFGTFKQKVGTTNVYLAVKPEVKVESNIFSSVYLIGQAGLSLGRFEFEDVSGSLDTKSGLYLGFGMGTTIKDCVIVELVFSSANFALEESLEADLQYTGTTINVGYKFNI